MNLVRAALKNPYAVVVLILVVAVIGFNSLRKLPADLLPIFKSPAVQIVTLYPGMPPVVVEKDISSRLQRWTGQAVGIARQEAKNMLGVSIVRDYFREDIDPDSAMSQVTSLAVSDMFYLPPGTLPPMVMPFDPTASVPTCLLSVFSETMTEKELYDVAYFEMRNRLQAIQGVIAPAVYGGVLRRILAYVDPNQLEARNLSPLDVANTLRESNPFVPTGSADLDGTEYFILSNAMVSDVEDLNDVPIGVFDGVPVRIGDVGHATDTHQIQTNIVRINGRRQVYIPVYRQPGGNTLAIVDEVKAKAERILAFIKSSGYYANTDDLGMDVVMDQSTAVRGSIGSLRNSALLGALLVALVVFVFLRSLRSTLIVLVTIPTAVLGAFAGLFFTGDTINAMTLGGLSLAIGILVDQAIVVMENIARHQRMGKSAARAALDGAGEVALPVLVSTVTFLVVFFPVVFLTGLAKFLFTPLALAVVFATVTSYVVAMTFIPAAASRLLKPAEYRPGVFDKMADAYRGIAQRIITFRWRVLLLTAGLFLASAWALTGFGRELFPKVDAGQFMILARAEPGTPLRKTELLLQEIEREVTSVLGDWDPNDQDESSDLRLLISNIGVLYDWPAGYTPNAGPMDGFLLVQLKDSRRKTAQEYANVLRKYLPEKIAGVEFAFDTGGMMTAALNFGLPAPINIQVRGSDLDELQEIARAIADEARRVDNAVDVRIGEPPEHPAISITVDRTMAAMLGLTQEDVIKNVATAINSSCNFAPAFWIDPNNGNHYLMGAQYEESDIQSFETIENIPITGPNSETPTLLKNIAKIERTSTPVLVNHQNITRTVNVFADVHGRDVGSVAAEIWDRIESTPAILARKTESSEFTDSQMTLSGGYRVLMGGEFQSMRESFGNFSEGLVIAIILVYLCMVAQFRSFVLPLAVMLTIPLGIIGVVPVLWLTGTHLSIPAFMGLILMVGIVVQYSILVVEFAARRQRGGAPLNDAILDAARDRLRPVLMTSLTTCLALLPMAIGIGRGGEANIPLARSIIGAVIGGTVLSLLVVPALYSLLGRWVRPEETLDLTSTEMS